MKRKSQAAGNAAQSLRDLALQLPEAEEGIACAGTPLEKRTIKVRGKAFLFLGSNDLMLKLRDLLPEATEASVKASGQIKVGVHGWVTMTNLDLVPLDQLARWLNESYRLLAPKQLAALLSEHK